MNRNFIICFILTISFSACQRRFNKVVEYPTSLQESYIVNQDTHIGKVAVLQSKTMPYAFSEEKNQWYESSLLRPSYLQRELFIGLAKRVAEGKLDLALQSFLESNSKVKRHKLQYSSLSRADRVYIGNTLDVDGLIVCEFYDGVNDCDWIENYDEIERIEKIVFYISMFDARNGKLAWREKTTVSVNGRSNKLGNLVSGNISSLLKDLPRRVERAGGYKEITFL
ncbi:hypothetical protein [uncultured Arcticibacterium sp.]|uniref:hypothetical protein n=1 Tax=uncultured Arcticibacterium sp. TaxID=2173042 RepID=UPI0030F6AE99